MKPSSLAAIGFILCGLPYAAVAQAGAQTGQQAEPSPGASLPTIRVQVNEVIVPVTVTDDKGRFLSNLTAEDFQILDEGKPQRIQFFSHTQNQPIVVGFLVDLSNATRIHWATYQEAIKELIWGLLPGDEKYSGYLISYSNGAEIAVNTTTESDKLSAQVDKMKPAGGSALYDAIYLACTRRDLVHGEPYEPRRVIVIIGDGHDNASSKTLDEVLELAKRNLVTIYGMSTVSFGFNNDSQGVLEKLANETGGRVEYPLNTLYKDVSAFVSTPRDAGNYVYDPGSGGYAAAISKGIINAVGSIQGEITTQYVLRYTPDIDPEPQPKLFREIKVVVPSLPEVRIRARDGYYPAAVPGSKP